LVRALIQKLGEILSYLLVTLCVLPDSPATMRRAEETMQSSPGKRIGLAGATKSLAEAAKAMDDAVTVASGDGQTAGAAQEFLVPQDHTRAKMKEDVMRREVSTIVEECTGTNESKEEALQILGDNNIVHVSDFAPITSEDLLSAMSAAAAKLGARGVLRDLKKRIDQRLSELEPGGAPGGAEGRQEPDSSARGRKRPLALDPMTMMMATEAYRAGDRQTAQDLVEDSTPLDVDALITAADYGEPNPKFLPEHKMILNHSREQKAGRGPPEELVMPDKERDGPRALANLVQRWIKASHLAAWYGEAPEAAKLNHLGVLMEIASNENLAKDKAERLAIEYDAQLRKELKKYHNRHQEKRAKQAHLTETAFYDRDRAAFEKAESELSQWKPKTGTRVSRGALPASHQTFCMAFSIFGRCNDDQRGAGCPKIHGCPFCGKMGAAAKGCLQTHCADFKRSVVPESVAEKGKGRQGEQGRGQPRGGGSKGGDNRWVRREDRGDANRRDDRGDGEKRSGRDDRGDGERRSGQF